MKEHDNNPNDCSHDCAECGSRAECGEGAALKTSLHPLSDVKKVIAVMSGKGGVGKSMTTALAAVSANSLGFKTAVIDADITGSSIPRGFGLKEKPYNSEVGLFPLTTRAGIDVMSINLLMEDDSEPLIWRAPIVTSMVSQFWSEVIWDGIDYMFIDMPPGTGDVALTVLEQIPVDGIIMVTSPQELVGDIVGKALKMAGAMNVPVIGLIENMSCFVCPDCGKKHFIFGKSRLSDTAAEYNIPVTAHLPIIPQNAALYDRGEIESADTSALKAFITEIDKKWS